MVLSHEGNDIAGRAFFTYGHIYGHIAWRRRWLQSDGHGSVHVGLGVGPTVAWETYSDGEAPVTVARRAVLHPARARWAQLAGRDHLHAEPLPAAAPDRADGSDGGLEVVTDPCARRTGNFMRPVTARRHRVASWLRTTTRRWSVQLRTPGGRPSAGPSGTSVGRCRRTAARSGLRRCSGDMRLGAKS